MVEKYYNRREDSDNHTVEGQGFRGGGKGAKEKGRGVKVFNSEQGIYETDEFKDQKCFLKK